MVVLFIFSLTELSLRPLELLCEVLGDAGSPFDRVAFSWDPRRFDLDLFECFDLLILPPSVVFSLSFVFLDDAVLFEFEDGATAVASSDVTDRDLLVVTMIAISILT